MINNAFIPHFKQGDRSTIRQSEAVNAVLFTENNTQRRSKPGPRCLFGRIMALQDAANAAFKELSSMFIENVPMPMNALWYIYSIIN